MLACTLVELQRVKHLRRWAAWACLGTLCAPSFAAATEPRDATRLTIDHIEHAPSTLPGIARLQLWVSAMSIGGTLVEAPLGSQWRLHNRGGIIGSGVAVSRFDATDRDLAVALVVQLSPEFTEAMPSVASALSEELVAHLPRRTQLAVIRYGETVTTSRMQALAQAKRLIDDLTPDAVPAEPAMLEAIERAQKQLTRTGTARTRRVLVLISDGRDFYIDKARVTKLGQRLGQAGIRLHALAFAPTNSRRPLLHLGELARQAQGTFRWVRTEKAESWRPAVAQLADELSAQYVLTALVPESTLAASPTLYVEHRASGAQSRETKLPAATCGDAPCPASAYCVAAQCHARTTVRGRWRWWMWLGLGLGGLGGALFGVRRLRRRVAPPSTGASVPAPGPPQPAQPALQSAPSAASNAPRLLVLQTGQIHLLPPVAQITLGTSAQCTIVIVDNFASTMHAVITRDAHGRYVLTDNNATNGTYLNGVRTRVATLSHGMTLRLGNTELRFLG